MSGRRGLPKVHLERWRGEGDITCCGKSSIYDQVDILNEEQAEEWVPESDADICKVCLSTDAGKESLRSYRQHYELKESDRDNRG